MSPNKSKRKGSDWERLLVQLLTDNIGESKVKRIAGSGALGTSLDEPLLQADVVAEFVGFPRKFRFEAKTGYGGSKQLAVKKEWIDKIIQEAKNSNSIPVLACKFSGARKADGVQYFVVLDISTFFDIINYVDDLKKELNKFYK